eukprot:4260464-Amphidinium_carterae.1
MIGADFRPSLPANIMRWPVKSRLPSQLGQPWDLEERAVAQTRLGGTTLWGVPPRNEPTHAK